MSANTDTRLLDFVTGMTQLVGEKGLVEREILDRTEVLMRALIAKDDWLPSEMAQPDATYYQQHLLYGDPLDRFSVVSFVWGPGQKTPIHNHCVWGMIGMLRGAEHGQRYGWSGEGGNGGTFLPQGERTTLNPGDIERVSPAIGDIHLVSNAFTDAVSISIHVYGGNIGKIQRHVFDPSGTTKPFVSGYSNRLAPNLWRTA